MSCTLSRRRMVLALLAAVVCPGFLLLAQGPPDKPPEPPASGEAMASTTEDQKLLKEAGLPTDGPGLLEFFRKRTPTKDDETRLPALVRQLGERAFAKREKASQELIEIGDRALPFLRTALDNADPEIARRAQRCIESIEAVSKGTHVSSAARVLAARKPDGALEALLAYLPHADPESPREALYEMLAALGVEGKGTKATLAKPILAAATDPAPERRAAAAHLLGQVAGHGEVLAKLASDSAPRVRFHAALSQLQRKDGKAVPILIALLGEESVELAWRAEEALSRLSGEKGTGINPVDFSDATARKKYRDDWQNWWKANEKNIDLAKINLGDAGLGLILTCEIDGLGQFPGRVSAFDRQGNTRWAIEGIDSPSDFQLLPGGRVLVAEHWGNRVTLRDRSGKVLWEHKVADKPTSCERLPGGNTFIATYNELLEVTAQGTVVFSHKSSDGMIYCARKLPGGNILYGTSSGKIIELNPKGEQVHSFTPQQYAGGAGYWVSVDVLPGGRYLVSLSGSDRVVETDRTGKILWEATVSKAIWAQRLPNGNTLVADVDGKVVVEVDRQGKQIWSQKTKGRPFRVRRY